MTASFSFDAELWEHDGPGSWHFLSLPEDVADEIDARFGHRAKGFGSHPVEVTIGATTWSTSIFPDTRQGTFVLPVKKAVRTAEGLAAGSTAAVVVAMVGQPGGADDSTEMGSGSRKRTPEP